MAQDNRYQGNRPQQQVRTHQPVKHTETAAGTPATPAAVESLTPKEADRVAAALAIGAQQEKEAQGSNTDLLKEVDITTVDAPLTTKDALVAQIADGLYDVLTGHITPLEMKLSLRIWFTELPLTEQAHRIALEEAVQYVKMQIEDVLNEAPVLFL